MKSGWMKKAGLVLSLCAVLLVSRAASAAEMAKEPLTTGALIAKLAESKTEKERYEIVAQLAKLGAPAVPEVKEALRQTNWRVQWGSAMSLGMIGDKSSAPALIDLLKNGTDPGKRGAAIALGMLKDQSAVPHLMAAMNGVNGLAAVEALGMIGDRGVTPILMRFMEESRDNDEKRVAAEALGRLKDPMAIPVLIDGLKANSWQVHAPSRWALTSIGKPAVPDLIGLLSFEKGDAARLAAEALGEMKEPTAVKPLITAMKTSKGVPTRIAAAEALGQIGDPVALPALMESLEDKGEYTVEFVWKSVRVSAAEALSKMPRDAQPILVQTLKTAKGNTLEFTCLALDKIHDKSSVQPLIEVIGRLDDKEKVFPVRVLGSLGSKEAVPVLLEVLKSKEAAARREAATALGGIGDESALPALLSVSATDPDAGVKRVAQRMVEKIQFINLK